LNLQDNNISISINLLFLVTCDDFQGSTYRAAYEKDMRCPFDEKKGRVLDDHTGCSI
jgi:hypothetical protein